VTRIGQRGSKLRSGRKGISELVAALIMILIVMAGAIIVYVYSSGMLGSLQGAQPQQSYTDHISLEYYDWTKLTTLNITVRNTGTSVLTMVDFFVGNSTWNFNLNPSNSSRVVFGSGCNSPAGQLNPQSVCKIALKNIPTLTRGSGYFVKIITRTGAAFSYTLIAGSFTS
jgi:flagellin-like protein